MDQGPLGRRRMAYTHWIFTREELDKFAHVHESRFYYKQEAKRAIELLPSKLMPALKFALNLRQTPFPVVIAHPSMFWVICLAYSEDAKTRYILGDRETIIEEPVVAVDHREFKHEKRKRGRA